MFLCNRSILAWVVHGEVDDVSMLRECRAKAVLNESGAVNIHRIPFSHPSPLWVWIWPWEWQHGKKIIYVPWDAIWQPPHYVHIMRYLQTSLPSLCRIFFLFNCIASLHNSRIWLLTSERSISVSVPFPVAVSIPLSASISVSLSVPFSVSFPASVSVSIPVPVSFSVSVPLSIHLSVAVSLSVSVHFAAGWHGTSIVLVPVAVTWADKAAGPHGGNYVTPTVSHCQYIKQILLKHDGFRTLPLIQRFPVGSLPRLGEAQIW